MVALAKWDGRWVFSGSWFQILSHLHSTSTADFQSLRNRGRPANHLIALVLKPLELGWTQR